VSEPTVHLSTSKGIGRIATVLAALTLPVVFFWNWNQLGLSPVWAFLLALLEIGLLRGGIDLLFKRVIDTPELTLDSAPEDMTADALQRRRWYFWSRKFRLIAIWLVVTTIVWKIHGGTWPSAVAYEVHLIKALANPQILMQMIILPIFFLANFLLFFGPMMMMGISQMQGLEPGDADFGVKLDDVRGQKEAKVEIRKVVTLWQSGAKFVAAGGKRERGILFLGPPGTGKTMLAKAIATGFNCPIVLMPGSGFAQTFIGMDVIIVRFMARKARKLASKWSGSCIIFIDEIDAVGMRRAALGGGGRAQPQIPGGGMGGMMGGMGQMGLQSLLVVMDGIDNPPFFRKLFTNKLNLWLDAMYIIPQKIGSKSLRLPKAKPTSNQIFFVGATNVPLENLDPALTRPGRMGRHIHFRTPTKRDRADIFDLYLGKVAHEPELDTEAARDELVKTTQGYSPADIEQVCSIALTYAHSDGRPVFNRDDIQEAMVTVEAGTALGWGYESEQEEFSTAVHEAGHAVCAHLYKPDHESTRLSIQRRGQTGGHHQTAEAIERSFKDRAELFADLIHTLGAHAAETVFFGHNTMGVGGDLGMASNLAGTMVGKWGMWPLPIDQEIYFEGGKMLGATQTEMDQARIRMEKLGKRLLAVANFGDVQLPRDKYKDEAILVGHAYVIAYNTALKNKAQIAMIAKTLVEKKEIFGNDLVKLLDDSQLEIPTIDWNSDAAYPSN